MSKESSRSNIVFIGKLVLSLLVFSGFSGCSTAARDANGDATGDDLSAPVVSSTTPTNAAQDVGLTVAISATFNEAMDAATLNTTTFTVQGPEGTVPGTVAYNAASRVATFTFQDAIAGLTPYTATLSTGVKDALGVPLIAAYSWNFTTTNSAWLHEGDALVKVSSANEELKKIAAVNCTSLSAYTQWAVDYADGSMWVADTNNNRLFKLDADGRLLALYSQNSAQGTAIDPRNGSVWSSEYLGTTAARKLIKRSSLGLPVLETAGGLSGSMMNHSMDWNTADHSLWFADYSTGVVKIIDTIPASPAYNAAGASSTHHVRNNTFAQTMSLSVFPGRTGVASHIWAAERGNGTTIPNAIVKLNNDGTEALRFSAVGFNETRRVSANLADGSVWASGTDRIAKYSATGEPLVNQGGFSAIVNDIAVDLIDGGAWVGHGDGLARLSATGSEKWRRQQGEVQAVMVQTKRIPALKIYVSKTGNDLTGDGSVAKPYITIAKALGVATAGTTVLVSAGTYGENVTLKSKVRLVGAGYATTTIQGLGTTNVVEGLAVDNATVEGFTITGASATTSGVYCADCNSVIVRNNHIRDNGASTTSNGIVIQGVSNLLVEKNRITNNSTGGIYLSPTSQAIIRNNIIANNGDIGIYRAAGGLKSYIINNVIDRNGNAAGGRSGLMIFSNDVVSNNIVSNNGTSNPNAGLAVGIYVATGTPTLSYNNVYGNSQGSYTGVTAGTGDISVDPKFVGTTDYHLQTDSPSVNTGDPALSDIGIACDTPARRSDMGAYGGPWGNW